MPELPEVETIRRQLLSKLRGQTIKKVEVKFAVLIKMPAKDFVRIVTSAKVIGVERRAKILMIDLSNGWTIFIHLKLTGQLIYDGQSGIGKPHIVYTFSNGIQLKHHDSRKLGYVKLIKTKDVEKVLVKKNLGPEPLDKNFTLIKFKELLARKVRSPIKPLLMDQTFLAGIGNIYAQEACFAAKILPTRKAGALSDKEIKDLYLGLLKILRMAIKTKGSSVDSYVDALGAEGKYVLHLKVYGRGGQKCLRCGVILKESKLAGRGTVWCAKCQK